MQLPIINPDTAESWNAPLDSPICGLKDCRSYRVMPLEVFIGCLMRFWGGSWTEELFRYNRIMRLAFSNFPFFLSFFFFFYFHKTNRNTDIKINKIKQ